MGNQAIRKPKFLEDVEMTNNVVPLAFGMTKDQQESLGVVKNLALEQDPTSPPVEPTPALPSMPSAELHAAEEMNEEPEPPGAVVPESTPEAVPDAEMGLDEPPSDDLSATVPNVHEAPFQEMVQPPAPSPELASVEEGIGAHVATEKMIRMVEHMRQANTRLAEEARSTALEIGFQVAQRILEREVSADVTAMIALIRSALRKVGDSKVLRLSLHPQDHESVSKALEDGQFTEIALAQIELVPNASLDRGDVVVDTDFGQIDGRIKTRLKEIKTVIDDSQEGDPS
ncbi:MAG: hypothetical protein CMH56_12795 [Myxococcales bacterium]|nr:hypothetical protein [Myxococcales bacterium]|tara:strand:- start:849 stop:1706 length:858 start_codon:yes stop_codon:yes gene_type:complete